MNDTKERLRSELVKTLARRVNGYGANVLREGEIQTFAELVAEECAKLIELRQTARRNNPNTWEELDARAIRNLVSSPDLPQESQKTL